MPTTPEKRITEKFSELVERSHNEGGIDDFSTAERAVWFIVSTRCEIDIADFISVFEQFLSKADVTETSDYLDALGLTDEAKLFDEVLDLLVSHEFYGDDDRPSIPFNALPQHVFDRVDAIGDMIGDSNVLWDIDDRLCDALDSE